MRQGICILSASKSDRRRIHNRTSANGRPRAFYDWVNQALQRCEGTVLTISIPKLYSTG